MAQDSSFLYDKFRLYYDNAVRAHKKGQVELAKRNYALAAESLLQVAKESTGQLKKAQYERAMRLIDLSERLKYNSAKRPVISSGEDFSDDDIDASIDGENAPKSDSTAAGDDDAKEWKAAQIPDIHFSDIAGLESVKKTITLRMIYPVKYPEKSIKYKRSIGGGVLLYGPPGTGKTMIAKAIACEVGATFYAIKGSDVVSKWVGESEKNISSLFETARKDKLAIIFIDEMDGLLGKRGVDVHNDRRVNEFLQQIDGFIGRNPNLLLLGSTNRPWDIDIAALRSGRFSERIYIPLPDEPARLFLFNKFLNGLPLASDVSAELLAQKTEGYSGADIELICNTATNEPYEQYCLTGVDKAVTKADFEKALSKIPPSVDKNTLAEFERYAKGFED